MSTKIRNTASREQLLAVWSCSYPEQWTADSPAVLVPAVACKKNDVIRVILKPGEAYERSLEVRVTGRKAVTFRLGFRPADQRNAAVTWSNVVRAAPE